MRRGLLETQREEIVGGVAAIVLGVGVAISLQLTAVRAADLNIVAGLDERSVGVGEFSQPEADGPASEGADGGVGGDDQDGLLLIGTGHVGVGTHSGLLLGRYDHHAEHFMLRQMKFFQ